MQPLRSDNPRFNALRVMALGTFRKDVSDVVAHCRLVRLPLSVPAAKVPAKSTLSARIAMALAILYASNAEAEGNAGLVVELAKLDLFGIAEATPFRGRRYTPFRPACNTLSKVRARYRQPSQFLHQRPRMFPNSCSYRRASQ